jgi:hypothetical protein
VLERACELLTAEAPLPGVGGTAAHARRHAAAAIESELRSLEEAVLEGERTYELDASEMRSPARARDRGHGAPWRADTPRPGRSDRVAVRSGGARRAARSSRGQPRSERRRASRPPRPFPTRCAAPSPSNSSASPNPPTRFLACGRPPRRKDSIGRGLCESLRVPVDLSSLAALGEPTRTERSQDLLNETARRAWLAIAARLYAVATSLDAQLPALDYNLRFGSVPDAIAAGGINLLTQARLLQRPGAFRHRRAWGRQGIAISHAIEAYIDGLQGDRDAMGRAQLIVMTRLVRCVAALTAARRAPRCAARFQQRPRVILTRARRRRPGARTVASAERLPISARL